jgi:hypothetical protein
MSLAEKLTIKINNAFVGTRHGKRLRLKRMLDEGQ